MGKKQEPIEDRMEEEGADKPAPHQEVTLGDLGLLCLTTEVCVIIINTAQFGQFG